MQRGDLLRQAHKRGHLIIWFSFGESNLSWAELLITSTVTFFSEGLGSALCFVFVKNMILNTY